MSATTKNDKKQQLKKYVVFALMFIAFAGCMWLIFAPSEAEKEKQKEGTGFNADIPDPKKDEIIADKRDAYEQEQLKQKQKDRMRSLDTFMMDTAGDTSKITDEEPEVHTAVQPSLRQTNRNAIQTSHAVYNDINRTLGNFYEQPKEDPEKEVMKKRLEDLEAKLEEKETRKSQMDEQLVLMEKSYQLAAKYMPQSQSEGSPYSQEYGMSAEQMKNKIVKSSSKKPKAVPVHQLMKTVVSSLSQRLSDEELMERYDRERNYGFNSMDKLQVNSQKNTISACIHDEQKVTDGQSLRMRLTEPLIAGNTYIPVNTMLTGHAKMQGERLEVSVSTIEHEGKIIHVEMTVYDSDGQKGINIPGSMELNAAKEIAANMGSNLGSTINISQQSAGQQLISDAGRGLIQGTSQYLGKKFRTVTVTLKAGYKIMLLPKED
ncbi:conjugative transposon TraM protein [Dysgonomonas hofstadii]|uniref:Conjugative transposon TraM protein n=1 Tax=Dysgonomonas hofstadii TaxID=637886 RepID=A0A840CJB1_9BACT|nr:conjugative transposon protein TraM [Dysgonomonas hofstadii]MBB4035436.1 conjugative transposon TraM protein [Dysgonomonas hofstadii]